VLRRGIDLVQHLDPTGVCARNLRECLLLQMRLNSRSCAIVRKAYGDATRMHRAFVPRPMQDWKTPAQHGVAALIVDQHLHLLQKRI